tara:strand:+ start:441 stop:608 length:168 start_codon:yes stop_codon:yes gene_type:complete
MTITSAKYLETEGQNTHVITVIGGVTWTVPIDTANTHYQAIQEWVAEGNTIEEAD